MANSGKKDKCLRALMDAARFYDRGTVEDCFKKYAGFSLLTVPETEEGLELVKRLFTDDIENNSLSYDIVHNKVSKNVAKTFELALKSLDQEQPEIFKNCTSIYAVREKMLELGFASEDKIFDKEIEFSFVSHSYTAKYRLPLHLFNLEHVTKIAEATLKNAEAYKYFTRSMF